jgi:hypothetical protein
MEGTEEPVCGKQRGGFFISPGTENARCAESQKYLDNHRMIA